ncbi:heavy metal sensor histidine kinase [Pyxidicoccus fallax]|uniref:histidine kinase n=1 Tax=Pyxidicoccus fallax TaxID=394095 RepID=A0A848LBX1_9BACT|nr:heavy metal sensor histidine kinase [Pyxidicoccus fallax]NMO15984.1 heavy metal sensor histidine kinase [Pyxidicoccus fallax]NPC77398.1 heavy metal sensor histidine kinase [Pyxidicoccus fallax]
MKVSIATRLAVMFAVASLAVFSLVGFALKRVLHRELDQHQLSEVNTRLDYASMMIARNDSAERWQGVRNKLDALTPLDGSARFWVMCPDERFQYGDQLELLRERLSTLPNGPFVLDLDEHSLRASARRIEANGQRPAVELVTAVDSTRFIGTQKAFTGALVALCLGGVALVALLGYRIARMGLAPVASLSREAQSLSPRDLSQRLKPSPLPRELGDLVTSFNGALDRVERAYAKLEGFNADVAHELRTPLTNIIGQTQVALSKERTADQLEEVLQSNLEELDRLRAIVNDMLFLARADQGATALDRVHASAAEEVSKTVEYLEVLQEEAGVTVRVEGDAQASFERSLFRRAASNLLLNAIEHSEPGAEIVVGISRRDSEVRVAVTNPGAPIPEPHLERLFDRFYRADGARRNSRDNHGLGLSIVKAVAKMHGGTVFATSAEGRNTFGFTLSSTPTVMASTLPAQAPHEAPERTDAPLLERSHPGTS